MDLSVFAFIPSTISQMKFVQYCQGLPGYSGVLFPHCKSTARQEGYVIIWLGPRGITFRACSINGHLEEPAIEFDWSDIIGIDGDSASLDLCYSRSGRKPKNIRVFSRYVSVNIVRGSN